MSKTKKSKLLASMLCATVMAGLYAGPVMAGSVDSITGDSGGIHINIGHDKDDSTSINGGVVNGSDGLYITDISGNGWLDGGFKIAGKLTISSEEMVKALDGQKFTELTIGGQTFNSTQIDAFKQDYQQLKDDVAALDTTDLTGRVEALEANTTGISRDGDTTKISGNLETGTITAANGNFKVTDTGAIIAQRGSKIGSAYFGNGTMEIIDGNESEVQLGGNHRDGGYLKLNTKDDELVELTGDQLRDIKNGTQNIEYDEVNRQTVIESANKFDSTGMSIESMGGMTTVVGGQAVFRDKNDQFTQVMGGIVNASQDVVANGTSLVGVGEKTSELEEKTTAIKYTSGSTDPDAPAYLKMGTTTIEDKLQADIFSANQGTIGGVTMAGGAISAAGGAFKVDNSGNITAGTVNGVDVVNIEEKTTAIKYTSGSTDPDAPAYLKMGTTTIEDKLEADIFSANQGTIGEVTMAGGAISAAGGAFKVDNSGNIAANNLVTNKYDVNATFDQLKDEIGTSGVDISELKQKTSTLTVIENTPKGTITNISSHLNVQGEIAAYDVTTNKGASLN